MPLKLTSSGGGSVTLDVPATAGTFTVNLPAANGDVVVTGGGSTVQFGAGSVSAPSITFSGDTNTGIYSPAADTIAFTEGGVEAMRLDASGNVGIGTSSPAVRLAVGSNDAVLLPVGTTLQRPAGAAGYIRFNSTNSTFEGHTGAAWGTIPSTANTGVVTQGMLASGVAGNGPAFSAFQSSGQGISSQVYTKVVFQSEEFDTANCFDNGSTFRFTPNVAGYYQINGNVNVGSVVVAGVGALIYKNGGAAKWGTWTATNTLQSNVSALIFMNGTTDFVELYTWINANTTLGAISYGTYFQGFLARAA